MSPITASVTPGDRFFDHYDIATLEDPDFYPDGRDLGENYTYTSWLMSPCAKAGKINCVTCHTSSGRYRFRAEEKAQDACMPCHEEVCEERSCPHPSQGGKPWKQVHLLPHAHDIFCPDEQDRPLHATPDASATIAFKSPNACNICHTDKDAAWADRYVREWRTRDYQSPILKRATLIDAARKRDWSKTPCDARVYRQQG